MSAQVFSSGCGVGVKVGREVNRVAGILRAQALEFDCGGSNTGSVTYVSYAFLVGYKTLSNLPQFSHLKKGIMVSLHHRVVRMK